VTTPEQDLQEDAERVYADFALRREAGEDVLLEALCRDHPHLADALRALERDWTALEPSLRGALPDSSGAADTFFHRDAAPPTPGASSRDLHMHPGRVLGGYRLVELIGHGGMGQVWEAEEVSLRRRVALKLIRPDRAGLATIEMFEREARAGGRLNHPGIVTVLGAGETDEGIHYIAQELVADGYSLQDFLLHMRDQPRWPPNYFEEVARLFARIADALQVAHEAGVVHRDIKPQNILITTDDHPKISDFGLARLVDEGSLSMRAGLVGTWFYMSPEQARGVAIDARADVFGLGAVLYEVLTLRRAFEGDTEHQILRRILYEDPPAPHVLRSQVPPDLSSVCMKALEKRRDRRYPTMRAFADDLRRVLAREPVTARPPSLWHKLQSWKLRHPTLSASLGLAFAALVIITILLVRLLQQQQEAERARRLANWQTYRAAVSAAAALERLGEDEEALRQLALAPEPYRHWEWDHLAGRWAGQAVARRLEPAPGPVGHLVVAPDGAGLVGVAGGRLLRWDLPAGSLRTGPALEASVTALAASDDDVWIGTADGRALLWEPAGTAPPRELADVRCVDGELVPARPGDARVPEQLARRARAAVPDRARAGPAAPAAVGPDGERRFVADPHGGLHIRDVETGEEVCVLPMAGRRVTALALGPKARHLYWADELGAVGVLARPSPPPALPDPP